MATSNSPSRLKVLFLPRWYPNRTDPMPGLFILRHAQAVSMLADVAVIHVQSLADLPRRFDLESTRENGLFTIHAYYRSSKGNPAWYAGFLYFLAFFNAFRLMRQEFGKPDIVHVHVLTRLGLIAWFYKLITGTPYIITEHWSRYLPIVDTFHGFWRRLATRIVVKQAGCVTTVTKNLGKAMQDHGLVNNNYQVIQNVVDTELFHPLQIQVPGPIKQFVHISCFEDRSKNISGLLRSLALLSATRNDFECRMIGEGMDLSRMKKYADELGIPANTVHFDGLLEGESLAASLRNASFLVLFSNYENMPVVINEAFASGIPVVATRVGGIAEHVVENKGILVDAGDEAGLCRALSQMLDSCDKFNTNDIRKYAMENFSKDVIAEQFINIYRAVLSKTKHL